MDHGPSKGPFQGHPDTEPDNLASSQRTSDPPASPDDHSTYSLDSQEYMDLPPDTAPGRSSPAGPATAPLSPKGMYERDCIMLARLVQSGSLSSGLLRWMGLYVRSMAAKLEGADLEPQDQAALENVYQIAITLPPLEKIVVRKGAQLELEPPAEDRKRRRSRSLSLTPPAEKQRNVRDSPPPPPPPSPPRKTAPTSVPVLAKPQRAQTARQAAREARPTRPPTTTTATTTFAEATKRAATARPVYTTAAAAPSTSRALPPPPPPSTTATTATRAAVPGAPQHQRPAATTTTAPPPPDKPRYPPLIVERIDNWTRHFKVLADRLGRPPNGRPFGKGIRFSPADADEYRVVQSYLTQLEKEEDISWFSYSLPAERSLKICIRGLPQDTDTEEIIRALEEKGFSPEYVKNINGRQGRPGSVFYALIKRTPNISEVYKVTELLLMPGVIIEAWRGKKGPAQCHRCQQFRHSSHNCHRQQACVRCGEQHTARDCPRPREMPATCANCGGDHPANYGACPVFRKEVRNKRAGTVALTQADRRGAPMTSRNVVEETAPASLMAPANPPAGPKQRRKRGGKKATQPKEDAAPTTTTTTTATGRLDERRDSLSQTIGVLKGILEAVQAGTDAETATLMGLMRILQPKASA